MYQGYAHHHGWSFDTLEYMKSDLGQWDKSTLLLCPNTLFRAFWADDWQKVHIHLEDFYTSCILYKYCKDTTCIMIKNQNVM